ncbi:aldo/keto reductase [Cellulophaga sp. HaHaR_3_176]|uniref:aldo/keto reductase n=1 Tax=Cellulophaga sp. HaHaR_3_176 TaxID=1942464 RepID=UPI001C1FF300|nr:aldo/keto reductase [Cellulophaga sp. HaHaR_3_176]QWX83430.1 aldo/keto reductase [Cellulophaga sp. HaHaR_3_176]
MGNIANYSKIIAGTMTWGSWGKQFSANEMAALINTCLEIGITTFDHADIYGDYTNETDFGQAFIDSKVDRSAVQIISKCGIQMLTGGKGNVVKHYQYDKDYIIKSAEDSLAKLKTDYLDLFLLHRPSPLMHPNEISEAVLHLKNSGKIKKFGVSNFTPSQIELLETEIHVSTNQVEFSLTKNDAMVNGTLDDCISHKRSAMAWSSLGTYFREENKKTKEIKKVLGELQEKYNANESQLLLAWILKHPANILPVVGTTSKKRLQESYDVLKINLELQDWFLLLEASKGHEVA